MQLSRTATTSEQRSLRREVEGSDVLTGFLNAGALCILFWGAIFILVFA